MDGGRPTSVKLFGHVYEITSAHKHTSEERATLSIKRSAQRPQPTKPRSHGVSALIPIDFNMETATPSVAKIAFLFWLSPLEFFNQSGKNGTKVVQNQKVQIQGISAEAFDLRQKVSI